MTHHLESTLQMAIDYLPLLILFATAGLIAAIAIAMPLLLGPKNPNKMKQEPIESGMIPFTNPRQRFSVQYYMVAMLFILFDVEVLFLYPWAVSMGKLKLFGLAEMAVFLLILLVGYVFVWKKGAFEWD